MACHSNVIVSSFIKTRLLQSQARDAYGAQQYAQAGDIYTKMLQDNPYDAAVNYNMGLVLYAQKQYETALHYFSRAAEHAQGNALLQEQALFNQGDTYVHSKKLCEALGSFSKVLELNPKNQQARHNLEYVKKLLEQQKEDDQPSDKDKQSKDDSKSKDQQEKKPKDKQAKDQKSQDQEKDDQEGNRGQDQQSDEQKSDKSQNSKNKSDSQKDSSESGQQQKDQSERSQDKKDKSTSQEDQNSSDDVPQDQMSDKLEKAEPKKDKQSPSNSEKSKESTPTSKDKEKSGSSPSGQQQEQEAALQDAFAHEMQGNPKDDERLDERAMYVLQKLQEQEDYMQKQLLKMNVSKQGASKYGQKNW